MSMKPTDTILGPARGSVVDALYFSFDYAERQNEVAAYLEETYRLAPLVGLDPAIMVSQSAHETGNWTSPAWVNRLNPAGLGITDGPDFGFGWENGTDAARAQIVHMHQYVDRSGGFVADRTSEFLFPYYHLDPRRQAVHDAGYAGTVRTIADLTGKWATDEDYHTKVAAKGNAIFPGIPDQGGTDVADLTFGRVKHPPYQRKIVNNRFWNNLGPRKIVGVAQHSMVGTLQGSYNYINGGAGQALWDYSIGGATDGANDGVIWMHNDPKDNRSGWANGGSDGLEGDGPLFVRTLGIDAINRGLVSIERSDGGKYNTQPMSPKQFESICQLTAYYFDQAKVSWDRFPFNPHAGCVTHMLHFEFATKACPFPPVRNEIDRIQNRVRAILKAAQMTEDETPSLPPPTPIEQDHDHYPNGWTAKQLKARFGVLPRTNPGGSVTNLHFAVRKNPIAAIANAWIARGDQEGFTKVDQLPQPQRWLVIRVDQDTKSDVIWFEGEGKDTWVLFRPHTNVPWTWAS